MEKRNKKIRASGVAVEHTELDNLFLDIHKQLQQDEVDAAEASEANNKKLGKERQEAEKTWQLSMEYLSETQKWRNNRDDDFYVNDFFWKKFTRTILFILSAYLSEKWKFLSAK